MPENQGKTNGATAVALAVLAAGAGAVIIYLLLGKKQEVPTPVPGAPAPPGQPTVDVNVTGPNTAEATVSWSPVPGATYYKVYINNQEALSNVIGTTAKITNLVPGQTYQIAVAACN